MKKLILLTLMAGTLTANVRDWTNREGNTFSGELLSATPTEVSILRVSDRQVFTLKREILSQSDNQFIDEHIKAAEDRKKKEELRRKLPDKLRDVKKLNEQSGTKTIIFYGPDFPKEKFESLVFDVVLNDETQRLISGKALFATIQRRDRDIEEEIPWAISPGKVSVLLYTDLFEHISFNITDEIDASFFQTQILPDLLKHKR